MTPRYEHSGVRLYCGDAVSILRDLGVRPQLVLTSPPYDELRDYGGTAFDFDAMADGIVSVMPEGGVLVWVVGDQTVDGSETGTSFRQALGFINRGLLLHDTMIYESVTLKNPSRNRYNQAFEFMFVFCKGKIAVANLIQDKTNLKAGTPYRERSIGRSKSDTKVGKFRSGIIQRFGTRTNVWRYGTGNNISAPDFPSAHAHPAIFPLPLAQDHIRTWTNEGDIVLDPMCGSGTTLRAAKNLNRQAIGVEIHEPYCELIINRMAQDVMDMAQ